MNPKKFVAIGIIGNIVFLAVICVVAYVIGRSVFTSFNNYKEVMQEPVGMKTVINGDTLMILDYSLIKSTYTLENGLVVDEKVAIDNLLNE